MKKMLKVTSRLLSTSMSGRISGKEWLMCKEGELSFLIIIP
jgi:hypothetical protein